jgi:hypothetical protein
LPPNEVLAEKLQNEPEVLVHLCCHLLMSYKGGGQVGVWVMPTKSRFKASSENHDFSRSLIEINRKLKSNMKL